MLGVSRRQLLECIRVSFGPAFRLRVFTVCDLYHNLQGQLASSRHVNRSGVGKEIPPHTIVTAVDTIEGSMPRRLDMDRKTVLLGVPNQILTTAGLQDGNETVFH